MNELITVEINENNEQIVSARLLHGCMKKFICGYCGEEMKEAESFEKTV